jgi:hypothetical protein
MTPKEQAIVLVYKFDNCMEFSTPQRFAKQCALIAVDEITANIEPSISEDVASARFKYWEEVKIEINKLWHKQQ